MRENKIAVCVCSLFVALVAIIMFFVPYGGEVVNSLLSGVLSGFVVSVVLAMVNYILKRQDFIYKLQINVKSLYVNMLIIHEITGDIINKVQYATLLSQLKFNDIHSLAQENLKFF